MRHPVSISATGLLTAVAVVAMTGCFGSGGGGGGFYAPGTTVDGGMGLADAATPVGDAGETASSLDATTSADTADPIDVAAAIDSHPSVDTGPTADTPMHGNDTSAPPVDAGSDDTESTTDVKICTGCCGDDSKCDDGNPCTSDTCGTGGACIHLAKTGVCDDGDACTGSDLCNAGACVGTPKTCADNNPCTIDTCEKASGCVSKPAPKGTECGSKPLGSLYKCVGNQVHKAQAFAGCDGSESNPTCSQEPAHRAASTYTLFKACDASQVCESKTPGTALCVPKAGGGTADLLGDYLRLAATKLTSLDKLNSTYRVRNKGSGAAGKFTVRFYVSKDKVVGGDTSLGYKTVNSLAAGKTAPASGTYKKTYSLPSSVKKGGLFYVLMRQDVSNAVPESDEGNNAMFAGPFSVQP